MGRYRRFEAQQRQKVIERCLQIRRRLAELDKKLNEIFESNQLLLLWIDGHQEENCDQEYQMLGNNYALYFRNANEKTALSRQLDDLCTDYPKWALDPSAMLNGTEQTGR